MKKSHISLDEMYDTLEYRYKNNIKVKTISKVTLYWKEEYTRWPNHTVIEAEDQVLTKIKIDMQGIRSTGLASSEEITKKVFFVLEL